MLCIRGHSLLLFVFEKCCEGCPRLLLVDLLFLLPPLLLVSVMPKDKDGTTAVGCLPASSSECGGFFDGNMSGCSMVTCSAWVFVVYCGQPSDDYGDSDNCGLFHPPFEYTFPFQADINFILVC
eukprot:RCo019875